MPPKKEEAKSSLSLSHPDPFVEIVSWVVASLIVVYVINGIIRLITSSGLSPFLWLDRIENFLTGNSWEIWLIRIILIILSVIIILFMADIIEKLKKFREEDHKKWYPDIAPEVKVNPQWKQILDHTESPHENDWRQAIIEADIMLDGLLKNMGLPGDSIGDKLKAANRGDFTTLDNAWEAHKIRNQIAHEGASFPLSARMARETISNYEAVFNEFKLI